MSTSTQICPTLFQFLPQVFNVLIQPQSDVFPVPYLVVVNKASRTGRVHNTTLEDLTGNSSADSHHSLLQILSLSSPRSLIPIRAKFQFIGQMSYIENMRLRRCTGDSECQCRMLDLADLCTPLCTYSSFSTILLYTSYLFSSYFYHALYPFLYPLLSSLTSVSIHLLSLSNWCSSR